MVAVPGRGLRFPFLHFDQGYSQVISGFPVPSNKKNAFFITSLYQCVLQILKIQTLHWDYLHFFIVNLPSSGLGNIMPYKTIADLPDSIRNHLPEHAQEIYMEAFNHAWEEYSDPTKRRGGASREEVTHKVAWAAVKKQYEKDEKTGIWKRK